MNSAKRPTTVPCPDCGQGIRLSSNLQKHEKLTCPNCWAYLVVINLNPIELAWDNVDEDENIGFDWDEEDDVTNSKG